MEQKDLPELRCFYNKKKCQFETNSFPRGTKLRSLFYWILSSFSEYRGPYADTLASRNTTGGSPGSKQYLQDNDGGSAEGRGLQRIHPALHLPGNPEPSLGRTYSLLCARGDRQRVLCG